MESARVDLPVGSHIDGFVAPGFERVADAFARNFANGAELGAAFAVYAGDEPVVDLWGGVADRASGRRWQDDTLVTIFSGTKGLVAICMLMLVERGLLDIEHPVSHYWPEFGKEQIRVRDVVSHTSRLPGIETPVSLQELFDSRYIAELLAQQAPSRDPRSERHYHPFTYGWLCGEILRRIDGRSIGRFFAEEVARPLELELWIGLPADQEARVATLELADSWPGNGPYLDPTTHAGDQLLWSVWANPPMLLEPWFPWNDVECHAAEIAGGGAIGTARSVAKLYASVDRLLEPETIVLGRTTLSEGIFEPGALPLRFGVGFQLTTELNLLGRPADAFGHGGAGGSMHGCWPELNLGFSYAMNLMRDDETDDGRAKALLDALYEVAG